MDKLLIIREIQRTANENAGVALGWRRFAEATGIGYYDWYGQYWTRWNDAVREAGFEPNRMTEAYKEEYLIEKLITFTRRLGRVPTEGDLLLAAKNDPEFPSKETFRRLGKKAERANLIHAYCTTRAEFTDVAQLWSPFLSTGQIPQREEPDDKISVVGYVYMLKHGNRQEYKIGRTNNPVRREGEFGILLPEKLQPVHYIETDDPSGIETYWHTRFANKRKEGEWFSLTAQDVRAFKRWRRIY